MAKEEKIKREKIIKVRVTPEEFETLKWKSTKAELAVWMRESCLEYGQGDLVTQMTGPSAADPELLRQLAGIGNNMNQVGRKVNTAEWGPSERIEIIAALAAIERELIELRALHR